MSISNINFPKNGKLFYDTEEIRLNTFGTYSEFGNNVQGVTNEHAEYSELYSTIRLSQFVSQNLTQEISDQEAFTEIDSLLQFATNNPQSCYKYQKDHITFVVTPELRSVYTFKTDGTEYSLIEDYTKSIPVNKTPEIRLIGHLDKSDDDMYNFSSSGLKMKLLLKADRKVSLIEEEPACTVDYYTEYM